MRRTIGTLAILVLITTACTAAGPQAPQQGGAGTPVRGGRIVQPAVGDVTNLNPILTAAGIDEAVWSNFYLPLLRINGDTGALEPGLAERFELSADGLTVTYTLRSGLVWSDGQPFTGEDYRYNVEALARAKGGIRKGNFADVVGWRDYIDGKTDSVSGIAVSQDGRTITLKLARTFCIALERLAAAGGGIIPRHLFLSGWNNKTTDTAATIDNHPLNNAPPASIGPFVFKERKVGVEITMTANDKYYRGRPNIDDYVVKLYSDNAAVKNALLAGEVSFAAVTSNDVEEVQKTNPAYAFTRVKSGYNYAWILWNQKATKAPWLAVKEVRQALWHGLNVKQLVDKVLFGYATQVSAHLAPTSWAYDGTGLNTYEFDQNKAKQLLEEAGAKMGADGVYRWTDGAPMQMRIETVSGNRQTEQVLQIVQEQYNAIGIKIDPLFESTQAYFARNDPTAVDREGTLGGWSRGPDPDSHHFFHSDSARRGGFNWANYVNATVDQQMILGRHGPDCSQPARKKAYVAVDRQLNEDAVYTFLYAPDILMFVNKQLQSVALQPYNTPNVTQRNSNVEQWWIKK